ncbi:MAG TPA: glycosyltransferase family 4 protein [Gemmatimonadales bacterium]|nr:glycosyltransferase family 4 protein [Gemmatimonadales bacterium]
MTPLRIALIAEDYYPQLGGVPEHVHHLARELDSLGHSTTIVTSNMKERGAGSGEQSVHADVRRIGTSLVIYANGGVARVTVGWRLTARFEALFRKERFDIVHVHGGLSPTLGIVAPRAAWRAGIPVIATFHTWFPGSIGYRILRRPFQWMLDRHAAAIAVSSAARDAMARYFTAPWEIIPNGVDTTFFRPGLSPGAGRCERRGAGRRPRLLWLGRIEPRNDLATVLAAMPGILERHPGAQLTVVGDGPWRPRMERAARRLGPCVQFAGYVNGGRPGYYRAADVYLCPTTRASFGVTLLEAMACGTPLVVSDIPAFRDLATASGAVFAPPGDAAAWARAVNGLLDDPARRAAMMGEGRAVAERHAWPLVAQRVLAVYRRVTG